MKLNARKIVEIQREIIIKHRERMDAFFRSLPTEEKTRYLMFWNRAKLNGGRQ